MTSGQWTSGRHDKGQLVAAQGQGIPLLHRLKAALHLHGEELA